MEGLLFREFLRLYHNINIPSYNLSEILTNPDEICEKINTLCRPQLLFEQYLRVGYYPFYDGDSTQYYSRIENVITFIIEQELTQFCSVDTAYIRKIKALMLYLSNNLLYNVNISKLASYLELSKQTVLSYLSSMNKAELLHLIYSDNKSVTKMQKPDKIFINNTNMLFAICNDYNIGTIRECFVVNQLSVNHEVEYSKTQGDFKIDGRITFEVGGKDKTFDQIANVKDSYILADSIEFPIGKKLPLWIVGLTY